MALIKDAKGRGEDETSSGYERLFGNHELGNLISKVQAAVISTGTELEKILANRLTNTDGISIQNINKNKRVFVGINQGHDVDVDCVILDNGEYKLIEIKDGDTFDTKKVAGELHSLNVVQSFLISRGIPHNQIEIRFCSFNAKDHQQIEKGTKGLLTKGMAMTGKELCELLEINFDEIVEERKRDQKANLDYFMKELLKIPEIKEKIK